MRRVQISLTVAHFDETEPEAARGNLEVIHVYSDSDDLWEALGLACSAATMRLCGGQENMRPRFGRCDIVTSHDDDEGAQAYLEMLTEWAARQDPSWHDRIASVGCFVKIHVQRFPQATPESYPKDEQVISVSCLVKDAFKALADAQTAAIDRVRAYEPVAVPSEDLVMRTNIDEEHPLMGARESARKRVELLKERNAKKEPED